MMSDLDKYLTMHVHKCCGWFGTRASWLEGIFEDLSFSDRVKVSDPVRVCGSNVIYIYIWTINGITPNQHYYCLIILIKYDDKEAYRATIFESCTSNTAIFWACKFFITGKILNYFLLSIWILINLNWNFFLQSQPSQSQTGYPSSFPLIVSSAQPTSAPSNPSSFPSFSPRKSLANSQVDNLRSNQPDSHFAIQVASQLDIQQINRLNSKLSARVVN